MSPADTQSVPVGVNGANFRVEVRRTGGYQDVGVLDSLPFDTVITVISELSTALNEAISKAAPKKASIEFGMALEVEGGKLVALLCQGKTTANLAVKLEWER